MTNPETDLKEADVNMTSSNPGSSKFTFAALVFVTFVAVIFGAGVVAGFTDAGGGDRPDVLFGIYAVWVAVVGGLAFLAARSWSRLMKAPKEMLSRSTRRSRNVLYAALVVSAGLGALLSMAQPEGTSIFTNGPLAVFPALVAIMVWTVGGSITTLMWWRMTDEHDRASYEAGANVAVHAYLFIAPSWWVATRAGLLPEQDPMVVMLIVAAIWSAVWFYRKYL